MARPFARLAQGIVNKLSGVPFAYGNERADAFTPGGTSPSNIFGGLPNYDAGSVTRRAANWGGTDNGPNAIIMTDGWLLRQRSRDTIRKSPYANAILEALVANMIGKGIRPLSKAPDAIKKAVADLFADWCCEADYTGVTDFYGLQALACRETIEGGEVFIRRRDMPKSSQNAVPMQIQLIESEQLNLTLFQVLENGNYVRAGIEFNPAGKRVAYWFYKQHPGEALYQVTALDLMRIPAEQIAHVFRPLRAGQNRGLPWLTAALLKLHDLDKYDDAEVLRKQIAAMFAAWVQKSGDDPNEADPLGSTDNGDGTGTLSLEPGIINELEPGETVTFSQPADLGGQYDIFMRTQIQAISSAANVLYEQTTGDLRGVNYSSIRAALLEFRRKIEMFQRTIIIFQMCRPIFGWFMDAAVMAGLLPISASVYQNDLRTFRNAKWVTPGWPWVDPAKDMAANKEAIKAGLASRTGIVSQGGQDVEDVDAEVAADRDRADTLGLQYDTDPNEAAQYGRGAAAPVAPDDGSEPVAAPGQPGQAPSGAPSPTSKPAPKRAAK